MPTTPTQAQDAEELVRRARYYDQNAMAMIQEIVKSAERGNPRAVSGLREIDKYIAAHPVEEPISEEAAKALGALKDPRNTPNIVVDALCTLPNVGSKDDVLAACVILACGPALSDEWLAQAADHTNEFKEVFLFAVQNAGDDEAVASAMRQVGRHGAPYLCAGHCVGMGRKIQAAANGHPEVLSPGIGWELGR